MWLLNKITIACHFLCGILKAEVQCELTPLLSEAIMFTPWFSWDYLLLLWIIGLCGARIWMTLHYLMAV